MCCMSVHWPPSAPKSYRTSPTYSWDLSDCGPPPSSRCWTWSEPYPGTQRRLPHPRVAYRPGILMPCSYEPPPLPSTCDFVLCPWRTFTWPGASHSAPPMIRKCHTMDIAGGGISPTSGPLSCPARDCVRSGTGGRSNLRPSPGTPPLGTSRRELPKGRISYTTPFLPSAVPVDGLPGNPPLGPPWTQDSGCAGGGVPGGYYPHLSSGRHMPLWSGPL